MIDLSALRKFEVLGPDAEALLDYAVTRDITKLAVGQVVYTAICHPHGGMLDDGTVFRLGPQQFRLICGDPYVGVHLRQLAEQKGFKAWVRSSTDQLHNVAVQGPKSRELLGKIIWTAADPARRDRDRRSSARPSAGWVVRRAPPWWFRAQAIPANSATRSSAIHAMARPSGTRCFRGRQAARRGADGPGSARHAAYRGRSDLCWL